MAFEARSMPQKGPRCRVRVQAVAQMSRKTHKYVTFHGRLSALKVLRYATGGTHEEGESAGRNRRRARSGSRGSCSGPVLRAFRRAPRRRAARPQATFTKDVAPILQRSCQNCHRPGSIGPMALLTYEDARPWARSMKNRVSLRQMPPWHVDRTAGTHSQVQGRSVALRRRDRHDRRRGSTVGHRRGNPADMPPAQTVRRFRPLAHRQAGPDRHHAGRSQRCRCRTGLVGQLPGGCRPH